MLFLKHKLPNKINLGEMGSFVVLLNLSVGISFVGSEDQKDDKCW
jgi:hypothetical protein